MRGLGAASLLAAWQFASKPENTDYYLVSRSCGWVIDLSLCEYIHGEVITQMVSLSEVCQHRANRVIPDDRSWWKPWVASVRCIHVICDWGGDCLCLSKVMKLSWVLYSCDWEDTLMSSILICTVAVNAFPSYMNESVCSDPSEV